jgi:hypothetical protein
MWNGLELKRFQVAKVFVPFQKGYQLHFSISHKNELKIINSVAEVRK